LSRWQIVAKNSDQWSKLCRRATNYIQLTF